MNKIDLFRAEIFNIKPRENIGSVEDCGKLGTSDHNMTLTEILIPGQQSESTEMVPDCTKVDFTKLKAFLAGVTWDEALADKNTEDSWDYFKTKLDEGVESCVPKKCRRSANKPMWMNQNVLQLIRKKRRLWNRYKSTKDYESMMAYKRIKAEVNKSVKNAKRKFERKLAKQARRKPRAFYSYVNKLTNSRVSVGPLKDSNAMAIWGH